MIDQVKSYERVRRALIRISRERYIYPEQVQRLATRFSRRLVFGMSHITVNRAIYSDYGPEGNPIKGCHRLGLLHGETPLPLFSKYTKTLLLEIQKKRKANSEPIELAILKLVIKEMQSGD